MTKLVMNLRVEVRLGSENELGTQCEYSIALMV